MRKFVGLFSHNFRDPASFGNSEAERPPSRPKTPAIECTIVEMIVERAESIDTIVILEIHLY